MKLEEKVSEIIYLDYWATGQLRYWIETNDPIHGKSLWKRNKKGEITLIKNIPQRFRTIFNSL